MNDASDFLKYILNIFDVKKLKVLKNNKIYYKSILYEVNSLPDLNQLKIYNITKFLKVENGSKILQGEYLIFRINRYFEDDIFYKTQIYPQKEFKLGKQNLKLRSIIVFENLHYTCYFLCEDEWYYYDDTKDNFKRIKYIGEYRDMLIYKPSPMKQGVLYFYEK
jgi:hypothetical protein